MNDLKIFNYHDKPLRTVEQDGELWWVLKDVCGLLGITDHKQVKKRLDDDETGVCQVPPPPGGGQMQNMTIINEPGLYNVILRSDKPEAKDFKRWVTHEVLPYIRKNGSYDMGQTQPLTPAQLIAAQAKVLVDMEQRMDQMQNQTRALEAKVETAIKVFSRPDKDHWKEDMDRAIKEVCDWEGASIIKLKGQMYAELEQKANCNINSRLAALRRRSKKSGMRSADAAALTKLDAIAADRKLRAIFEGIVRQWQATAIPAPMLESEGQGEVSYGG